MLGYSKRKHKVIRFPKNPAQKVESRIEVDTKLLYLKELDDQDWRQLKKLQGQLDVFYLKRRYGSSDTRILLAYVEGELAHVDWVVPARKIMHRYHFVTNNSYFIIASLTSRSFRGQRIYPSQLQYILRSDILTDVYWGLVEDENIASLKGVERSGGIYAGDFIQKRWFWGVVSRAKYIQCERGM
jgi:hypothetical protein